MDPRYLKNVDDKSKSQFYMLNFKSDIYSIGVLFWQLSSGCRPFYHNDDDVPYDVCLAMDIMKGRRETPIKGTPVEYVSLYTGK
jgi:hypothetical protein